MSIFEIKDKSDRKVRLTDDRWKHISKKHPHVATYLEEIKETLRNPDKIIIHEVYEKVRYYYKYLKPLKKYILVIVKYLNGEGLVITAYLEKAIK